MIRRAVATLLLVASASPPVHAGGSAWTRMAYSDVRADPALSRTWRAQAVAVDASFLADAGAEALRRLGGRAPLVAVSASFSRPGVEVSVSIALGAGLCDSGPNSATSTQIHSVCPMKVAVTRGATTRTLLVDRSCFLDVAHDASPGGPAVADNGDFAFLDASGRKLTVETIRDGAPIDECTRTVDVGSL